MKMDQGVEDFEKVVVASSTDLIAVLDREFTYLAANPAYLAATGKTRDELIGHIALEIFGRDVFEEVVKPTVLNPWRAKKLAIAGG